MSEAEWERLVLGELAGLGWVPRDGKAIAPGSGERESWGELIIPGRLREAIARINPGLPATAIADAASIVLSATSRDARAENHRVHQLLTKGIRGVAYADERGAEHNPTIWLLDKRDPDSNDFLAVRQVQLADGERRRRFDMVLYVNGLPLAVIELKKTTADGEALALAHAQLTTYVAEFPLAFSCNAVCVVTDGPGALYGTAFTPFEHFTPWNVDEHGNPVRQSEISADNQLVFLLLRGIFTPARFLELVNGYVTFARSPNGLRKLIAKAHQYFAVSAAIRATIEAVRGDGRAGVVWHTQGSGKSLEMELYANQVLTHSSLGNPTVVVITDRTDLDDQLFDSFQASELLPEKPYQVATRDELRTVLANKRMGGIVFTTLQKFGRTKDERESGTSHPLLSDRRNIVVIADEAHRSHYDDLDGYARHLRDALPYATLIACTGTPIAEEGRDTRQVFGPDIDTYDLTRAVDDGATVPVYYESRLISLDLPADVDAAEIDDRAEEAAAALDEAERARIQREILAMNTLFGADARLTRLSEDIVAHWEARSAEMSKFIGVPGKAMIVCATRDICADLYARIARLRPQWCHDDIDKGRVKVVYTGGPGDPAKLKQHVRPASQNRVIAQRAKDPDDELELVIVQSMWLTGFDSPPLHTLYVDKPMHGAALMQALARVNRTFRNKRDGLMVGYAPIAQSLYEALAEYSAKDRETKPLGRDLDEAIARLTDLHDLIGNDILADYDWRARRAMVEPKAHLNAVLGAVDYLRSPATPGNQVGEGEATLADRFRQASAQLVRMYSICSSSSSDKLPPLRLDVAFFEEIRIMMARFDAEERRARGEAVSPDIELYLRSLADSAVEAYGVISIYDAAGVGKPDLSHLDEAFIERMRQQPNPHLAIEALRRLVESEMRHVTRHNIVAQASFSERLEELMTMYTNQNLTAAQIIAELVALAQDVSADARRGDAFSPPLNSDELAFYDAVRQNPSAVTEMGDSILADIARDLVLALRRDVTTDWVSRDDVRAKIRSTIKRLLAKWGYPPDAQPDAIKLVLDQMETFADEWSPQA